MLIEGNDHKNDTDLDCSTIPAAMTDTGCERDLNEDRYAVVESKSGLAWLVCDGMGGATGGELAAQLAIDAIRRDLENLGARPPDVALRSALLEANRIIVLRRQNQAFAQMGTTVVACMFNGQEVFLGHVGDSRAYIVRDGAIQQLTVDHTYVQELVNNGQIRAEDALTHPQAHILTRAIGSEPALEVDISNYWIWPCQESEVPDFLVLCTDGLYSLVSEGEIANIVSQEAPKDACRKLVEKAKAAGGFDNITLAVIPLGGQLRQEPPSGFKRSNAFVRQTSSQALQTSGKGLGRTLLLVILLSGLAALVTMLLMAFSLGR